MASDGSDNTVGGDSARFMSDGLVLDLQNGRSVRPTVRPVDSDEPWTVWWSNPDTREVGIGPVGGEAELILYLSPDKAVFDQDGKRIHHYEWVGWMWCENENKAFDYPDPGEAECPHCGATVEIPEPASGTIEFEANAATFDQE